MQKLIPLVIDLSDAFDRLELRFAIGGALANNFWGIVRTTLDVDLLIAVPALKYQVLADELNKAGIHMRSPGGESQEVTVEQMRAQVIQRNLFECFRDSIRVELFVPVVSLQDEILRRAVRMPLSDRNVPVTTAEDLILLKFSFHREKDLQDVRGILWVQRGKLDIDYLKKWGRLMLEDDVQQELVQLIEQYAEQNTPGNSTD